ncbi:MAG: polyprenyl synthetase family protein [Sedimentisphaerales bacterium]|nr:polyprenyl synthetase family protein [Sedimentisphaerales bacterium]
MAVAEKDFAKQLDSKVRLVNKELGRILSTPGWVASELKRPVRYALEGPGKRIRSAVVLWCCELVAGKVNRNALTAAAAIEMVHTYSLIHDDLPAMDDDDYRRGRLTCHRKFDEATAILTGDALLTLAFELLAKEINEPKAAVKLIIELAEAAGPAGMVAGQKADLEAENGRVNKETLQRIHTNKTAKMFRCAAAMGGICGSTMLTTGGGANERQLKRLREYGLKIGLGFQIADDILDVSASSVQLGKTSGKDVKQGKATYPAIVGLEKSRGLAEKLAKEATAALKPFGKNADVLRELTKSLSNRTK